MATKMAALYDLRLDDATEDFTLLEFLVDDDESMLPSSFSSSSSSSSCSSSAQEILLDSQMSVTSEEEEDMNRWRQTSPANWTSKDVLDWIYSDATLRNVELNKVRGEYFQKLTGSDLCCMPRDEFITRDPMYGDVLFQCLHGIFKDENNNQTGLALPPFSESFPQAPSSLLSPLLFNDQLNTPPWQCDYPNFSDTELSRSSADSLRLQPNNDSDSDSAGSDFTVLKTVTPNSLINNNNNNNNDRLFSHLLASSDGRQTILPKLVEDNLIGVQHESRPSPPPEKRRPGRPRKIMQSDSSSSDLENNYNNNNCKKTICGKKPRSQGNRLTHLWEFMRTLLDNPEYSPECIKWENQEMGVFRIVPGKSKVIAMLWGARKNNETMTFDKLSRSLRWCRTYGFLSEVPKNGGYPKKLCFRFGDKALEWNRAK